MKRSQLVPLQVGFLVFCGLTLWLVFSTFSAETLGRWTSVEVHKLGAPDASEEFVVWSYPSNYTIPDSSALRTEIASTPSPATELGSQNGSGTETTAIPTKPQTATQATSTTEVGDGLVSEENGMKDDDEDTDPAFSIKDFVQAITQPNDTTFPRLECPGPDDERYSYLRAGAPSLTQQQEQPELRYFFALDLRQVAHLLPRLMGTIFETMHFLGPQVCALSIVEGNSKDGTYEILDALAPELEKMGVPYFLRESALDPAADDRIGRLAKLRNQALEPLTSWKKSTHAPRSAGSPKPAEETVESYLKTSTHMAEPTGDTTVIFLNDVAPCVSDLLELLRQRVFQDADMTCAMDWAHPGGDPTFYDVWVSRTINGNLFFDLPYGGSWEVAWDLFRSDVATKLRFSKMLPFQVYACWNGGVTFSAGPLLGLPPPTRQRSPATNKASSDSKVGSMGGPDISDLDIKTRQSQTLAKDPVESGVRFRISREGECFAGEPTLFCKDLWWAGYGRIAVVPSVNLEYDDENARIVKKLKGWTSEWTAKEQKQKGGAERTLIKWQEAPDEVICMPGLGDISWRPWNETMT